MNTLNNNICPNLTYCVVILFTEKDKIMIKVPIGSDKQVGSDLKYDQIIPFNDRNYTVAVLNGKSGLINFDGKHITPFIYDDLSEDYCDDMSYELGWVNFEHSYEKYCRMRLNGKWGLLDENGNVVVDFKYSNPVSEWGEHFVVEINGKKSNYPDSTFFVMDKNQNIHAELNFDYVMPRFQYAIVTKNYKYGIVNNDLKMIIDCKYNILHSGYNHKYIEALLEDKWGIIDLEENVVLDFIYDDVHIEEKNGKYIFMAKIDDKYELYNIKDERIS